MGSGYQAGPIRTALRLSRVPVPLIFSFILLSVVVLTSVLTDPADYGEGGALMPGLLVATALSCAPGFLFILRQPWSFRTVELLPWVAIAGCLVMALLLVTPLGQAAGLPQASGFLVPLALSLTLAVVSLLGTRTPFWADIKAGRVVIGPRAR